MIPVYELGFIINDKRCVVHRSHVFPRYPLHDMMTAVVEGLRTSFPEATVTQFQEYNGQPYSY